MQATFRKNNNHLQASVRCCSWSRLALVECLPSLNSQLENYWCCFFKVSALALRRQRQLSLGDKGMSLSLVNTSVPPSSSEGVYISTLGQTCHKQHVQRKTAVSQGNRWCCSTQSLKAAKSWWLCLWVYVLWSQLDNRYILLFSEKSYSCGQ